MTGLEKEIQITPYTHNAKYYETDQMGIIHHSNYIRWMEEARTDILKQAGISYKKMEELGVISPVLSVSCEYRSMVHYDDTVVIKVKTEKYNSVKLELKYEISDIETGELKAVGTSSHCFLNKEGHIISLKREYPDIDECFKQLLIQGKE